MKEILFRGKRSDYKEWVEGSYIFNFWGGKEHTIHIELGTCCNVDSETVCQYTGTPDKNGKRIFQEILSKERFLMASLSERSCGLILDFADSI